MRFLRPSVPILSQKLSFSPFPGVGVRGDFGRGKEAIFTVYEFVSSITLQNQLSQYKLAYYTNSVCHSISTYYVFIPVKSITGLVTRPSVSFGFRALHTLTVITYLSSNHILTILPCSIGKTQEHLGI